MDIQIFKENGWEIRAINKDGEPWFIGKDVAESLGYSIPRKAIREHCKGGSEMDLPSNGGTQTFKIIPESDLYRLIMRSKLESAERFQDWVCNEVLPTIRKTGTYSTTSNPITPNVTNNLKATIEAAKLFGLDDNQARLSANTSIKNSHGVDCMASLGITGLISETNTQYFTPTVIGKPLDLSAIKINRALEKAGLQSAVRDHKNRILWVVSEKGKDHCQLLDTNKKYKNGTPIMQIKWAESVKEIIK